MILFPHCKINLGLSIIEKRTDGYHSLETIFYPVQLTDIVEVIAAPQKKEQQLIHSESTPLFSQSGIKVPGDSKNNLCIKAYNLLKQDYPLLPTIQIHLHKNIPMGAGLGGGSSDGTAILKILNTLFNLNISFDKMVQYAAQLGSDCPYFLYDQPCHARGRGEILTPNGISLDAYHIALIHPGIHISTAWAFDQLHPCKKDKSILDIIQQPIATWKTELINDFEAPVFEAHPMLANIKAQLYSKGAIYASMSGSGSSLFGLFPKSENQPTFQFESSVLVNWI